MTRGSTLLLGFVLLGVSCSPPREAARLGWTAAERRVLADLSLDALGAPPTAALQLTSRNPLEITMGWSPSACRIASSFHMVTSALNIAVGPETRPPSQLPLQLLSSPYSK